MRAKAIAALHYLAVLAILLNSGFAAAATTTTWGKVKAQYHTDVANDPQKLPEDEPPFINSSGGDPYNLPVGSQYSDAQVLAWARTMPAVQQAMAEMTRRGYIALPDQDVAHRWNSGSYGSCAIFSYRHDPTVVSDDEIAVCFVCVVSNLNTITGSAGTRVFGGMMIVNRVTGTAYTADDVTAYAESDPSFDIEMSGDPGDPEPGIMRPGNTVISIEPNGFHTKKTFGEFVQCTGAATVGNAVLTAGTLTVTGGWGPVVAGGPWSFVALGALCLAAASITCFG